MTEFNIVQLKISQDAVRKYAEEVRVLKTELKDKDKIIKKLMRQLESSTASLLIPPGGEGSHQEKADIYTEDVSELKNRDYGPPYGPHNPTGNEYSTFGDDKDEERE